ncbi:MAG: hypothetical protein GY947_06235 [Rhodobacteraceae bacterium]|nr:hypothetical protein [Paracoccaceae bacterium]
MVYPPKDIATRKGTSLSRIKPAERAKRRAELRQIGDLFDVHCCKIARTDVGVLAAPLFLAKAFCPKPETPFSAAFGKLQSCPLCQSCAPNFDVKDYHHRMGVLLAQRDFSDWLIADVSESRALLETSPEKGFLVEVVEQVN